MDNKSDIDDDFELDDFQIDENEMESIIEAEEDALCFDFELPDTFPLD